MKTSFLMIILTLAVDDQLSAAFVNTDSLQECRRRAVVVRSILESGNYTIEALACREAEVLFSPFSHAAPADAERYSYRISFDEQVAQIAKVTACIADSAPEPEHYCATSTQYLLTPTP